MLTQQKPAWPANPFLQGNFGLSMKKSQRTTYR